jgi:hypothetical protein
MLDYIYNILNESAPRSTLCQDAMQAGRAKPTCLSSKDVSRASCEPF